MYFKTLGAGFKRFALSRTEKETMALEVCKYGCCSWHTMTAGLDGHPPFDLKKKIRSDYECLDSSGYLRRRKVEGSS